MVEAREAPLRASSLFGFGVAGLSQGDGDRLLAVIDRLSAAGFQGAFLVFLHYFVDLSFGLRTGGR